jgi:phospholipase/carboxylesterase
MRYQTIETDEMVTLAPPGPPRATVLWLHGLGADGHDFVPLVPELDLPPSLGIRFVFPHAPVRPITLNRGYEMRGWYDITSLTTEGRADGVGLADSTQRILGLVDAEQAAGVAPSRIVIAGFSQGGAVALHAGFSAPERLAGILALSTYLPLAATLEARRTAVNRDLPVLMCHGTEDPIVGLALGRAARDALKAAGTPVEWREYPMEHALCAAEITEIARWLKARVG